MAVAKKIQTGTTFHSSFADGNPLWRVVKQRGEDTWDCVVDANEPDWAGTRKVFGGEEIRRCIAAEAMWNRFALRNADFWDSVKEGDTVHYHNAFGQFVRGEVVRDFRDGKRTLAMRPTALVGAWKDFDLPRWYDSGTYSEGCYNVRQIAEGNTMQPNSSCMWESPDFSRPNGPAADIDPTVLEPIDLTPPEPTEAQAEAARLLGILESIRVAVSHKDGKQVTDFVEEYRERILEAARIVANVRLVPEEDGPSPKF